MEDMLILRPPPKTLLERGPPKSVRAALARQIHSGRMFGCVGGPRKDATNGVASSLAISIYQYASASFDLKAQDCRLAVVAMAKLFQVTLPAL